MKYFCSQQQKVAAAIQAGQWPEGCDPALCAHVESCLICSDEAMLAQAFRQSHSAALQQPQLPSAGILWWRAQLRRKNADLERMIHPVAVAEKIAVVFVALIVVALVGWQHEQMAVWASSIWGPLATMAQVPGLLLIGGMMLLVFGGFAVYLLKAKE
jgi:hypothetical protein